MTQLIQITGNNWKMNTKGLNIIKLKQHTHIMSSVQDLIED